MKFACRPYNCHKPLFIYLKKVQTPLFRTYIASYFVYSSMYIIPLQLPWICSICVCMNTILSTQWTSYGGSDNRAKRHLSKVVFRMKETESSTFETRARQHRAPKKCNKMVSITIYTFWLRLQYRPDRNIICCQCR